MDQKTKTDKIWICDVLQLLNTKVNRLSTEAYKGFEMGTPYPVKIIEDKDLALKALEIVYRGNCAAVEGLEDKNGHRKKEVVKGKIVSWGGAQTKSEGCECKLTKNMFFHGDLFKLCHEKKRKITEFSPQHHCF